MIRKPYLHLLTPIYKEWQKEMVSDGNAITELLDKVIVWVVSLATATILFIFSSFSSQAHISPQALKSTLIILIASICAGVIGRVFYTIASLIGYQLMLVYSYQLKMMDFPYSPRKLIGNETSAMIYGFLIEDFEHEELSIVERDLKEAPEKQAERDADARLLYNTLATEYSTEFADAQELMLTATSKSFGLKDDYFTKNKFGTRTKGIILRFLTATSYVLNGLAILLYGIALLLMVIKYSVNTAN